MIIKGGVRAGAGSLAVHVGRTDTNELVELKGCRGVLAQDVAGALQEMEAIAGGSRCQKFLYHAHIDPRADEILTPEQWEKAVATLEKNLGLEDHQRVVVEHVKHGRQHQHIIWNRVDVETLRAATDSNNYQKHEATSRQLEKEFGLEAVQGVHSREAGTPRPERTPEQWEFQQSQRTEADPREIKREVKALYSESDGGKALAAALAEHGYVLAKGDRRDFVLIDEAGGVHSLARMAGVKVAELRDKLADIEREKLPTAGQVKEADREGTLFHHTPEQPKGRQAAEIFTAYQSSQTGPEFAAALADRKLAPARATAEDVKRFEEARANAQESGVKFLPPQLKENELVAVDERGNVHKINERTTGASRAEIEGKAAELGPCMSVKQAAAIAGFVRNQQGTEKLEERFDKQEEKEKEARRGAVIYDIKTEARKLGREGLHTTKETIQGAVALGKNTLVSASGVLKAVDGILDFFAPPPPRKITPQEMFRSAEARQERKAQLEAEAKRERALESMSDDWKSGRGLAGDDLRNLSRDDLEAIKAHGIDDGLKLLVEDLERERGSGRQRERER